MSPPNPGVDPLRRLGSISVILPAHNEEANLVATLGGIRRRLAAAGIDYEIVVVDDGSTDGTSAILAGEQDRDPSLRIVRHDVNEGYGAAVGDGFRAATKAWLFLMDSDGQFDFAEIDRLVTAQARAGSVAAIGYRAQRCDSLRRRLAGRAWTGLMRHCLDVNVRDVDCAFKLIRREALADAGFPESRGALVSAETLARLRQNGYGWVEVPVSHYPRVAGEASGGDARVITRAFRELWKTRCRLGRVRKERGG